MLRYNPQESRHQFSHGKSLKHYRIYVLRIWKCDYWNEACSFQTAFTVAPFCTQSVIQKKKKNSFPSLGVVSQFVHSSQLLYMFRHCCCAIIRVIKCVQSVPNPPKMFFFSSRSYTNRQTHIHEVCSHIHVLRH
jgi:hypothetical protein